MVLKTIRCASSMLNVGEGRIRRAVSAGEIPVMKLGNRALIDIEKARDIFEDEKTGVTIKEASEKTGLSVTAIRRGMREGWIPFTKPRNCFVFDMDAVNAAIEKRINESRSWSSRI